MSEKANSQDARRAEVEGAIEAFEQILEAMPNDRVALQALYEAYEQLEDKKNALSYLVRLGQVIAEEQDAQAAAPLVDRLRALGDKDKEALNTAAMLSKLVVAKEKPRGEDAKVKAKKRAGDIKASMACAWNLLQAGDLTQEEYGKVVDDLTESSSKNLEVPVTVLHVLTDRGATNIERVMTTMSRETGIPIVPLRNFEIQLSAYSLLPVEFMKSNAAIPFELMGDDLMVAILDPYDKDLRAFVEEVTGRQCHYYLVTAIEYDTVLKGIVKDALLRSEEKEQSDLV